MGVRLPGWLQWTLLLWQFAKELAQFANFADAALLRQDSDFHYGDPTVDDGTGKRPAPIGSYEPNAWGIHDMHGSVNELCADGYLNRLRGGLDPWEPRIRKGTW